MYSLTVYTSLVNETSHLLYIPWVKLLVYLYWRTTYLLQLTGLIPIPYKEWLHFIDKTDYLDIGNDKIIVDCIISITWFSIWLSYYEMKKHTLHRNKPIPYSGKFSRTINFAVFVDFTATSKINPRKSYYSIQMQW